MTCAHLQAGDFAEDDVTESYLKLLSIEKNKVGTSDHCLRPFISSAFRYMHSLYP